MDIFESLIKGFTNATKRGQPDRVERPFQADDDHPTYVLFAWGYFQSTRDNGQHYLRIRRFTGSRDPCLQAGVANRAIVSAILAKAERRTAEGHRLSQLLEQYPTHVVRFGWCTPLGSNYDVFYLPLSFAVQGYYADGLARAFGERLMETLDRCQVLYGLLCPSTNRDRADFTIAACFWLGAAFINWLEQDLGQHR